MKEIHLGSFGRICVEHARSADIALPSSAEMRALDVAAIQSGTPSRELMERAGAVVVEEICALAGASAGTIVVLCGPGNNGGDGLVAARRLHEAGRRVVAIVAWAEKYSDDFLFQLTICPVARVVTPLPAALRGLTSDLREIHKSQLGKLFEEASVVVDALLGTGQKGAPRPAIAELVEHIRAEKVSRPEVVVLSIDIPTGVDADSGAVFSPCVHADRTVALECIKRGMVQFPARQLCGVIAVRSIGIDCSQAVEFSLAEGESVPRLRARGEDVHKGILSQVAIVGGSQSMPGAAALSSLAALHTGAGLVTRVMLRGWPAGLEIPECINVIVPRQSEGYECDDVEAVLRVCDKNEVVVLGPGIGAAPATGAFVRGVIDGLRERQKMVVIDADALNHIAADGISLRGLQAIITPHPGEAARLLGVSSSTIQTDRFSAARRLAELFGVVALLKGAGTIVHDGTRGAVVARGSRYLATPGSGDVLAGIVAACAPRSASLFDAAVTGAYIHARAGEVASAATGGVIIAQQIATAAAGIVSQFE